ncbi:cysteine--tRNA ligase [Roseibacterium sp. SDUM158016]|uniref:cysteine--tRNA ligase n=1 Tax=Roseicyclus sediminis TaxID=2980997 RepID=UPI0021CF2E5B|nr:cysteine--tRNA ligase [Roseibacterium sp. SDUM158016]MCU4653605.1 cysteine--tRNA ligase [Roseibacterium sp. SDUM158016]
MVEIRLRNSMTRKVERLEPIDPKNVRMYVCGPTVYDRAHLGNARPVVVFDVLYRLLRHVYGEGHVTYVRNITDVEDKIIDRAAERGIGIDELTRTTTDWFHEDMAALGVDYSGDPNFKEPHATDYIPQMVEMIEALISRGHAYEAEGHVLFDVKSYPDYGRLSGRSVDDMIAGARVEVAPYKRDPMDFVLWKPSSDDQPGWDSPWGRGRPGWHIECSAMSRALLGESFDIHGGGIDLQFPHHENEIAQSCCAHPEGHFASIWMHNEMLQVEGKKMSKSLGNFFTVRELLDQGIPGEVIRFVFLSTHYSKPMDWTRRKAFDAADSLRKMASMLGRAGAEVLRDLQPSEPFTEVVGALADDLNTHLALTLVRSTKPEPDDFEDGLKAWVARLYASQLLLGFDLREHATAIVSGDNRDALAAIMSHALDGKEEKQIALLSAKLTRERNQAIRSKDFSTVDALKAALVAAGVEVRMSKDHVELVPGPNFDPAKLEAIR